MDITLRKAKDYCGGNKEKQENIHYDIQEMRNTPNKIKEWYRTRKTQRKKAPNMKRGVK